MKYEKVVQLAYNLKCNILFDELLSKHTTFKIGGPADLFIYIDNEFSLSILIKQINKDNIPFFVLGKGSNLIVNEKGFRGIIIKLEGEFKKIKIIEHNKIKCGAGLSLASACVEALKGNLCGLEFAWGIPGTCGGALYMNAGAYDGEISKIIHNSNHIDLNGISGKLTKKDFNFGYRKSNYTESSMIITSLTLSLKQGNKKNIKKFMLDHITSRKNKQPIEYPSAGSIFKRPKGFYVGTLIQECGLKGLSIGGAQISEKHAGFIINRGGASFDDVIKLVKCIQNTVYNKFKVNLEPEVKFLF